MLGAEAMPGRLASSLRFMDIIDTKPIHGYHRHKTDSMNQRSRDAILRLGATFEGILRHHMLRPDGTWRDSAYFSILREEWPSVKERLENKLASYA